MRHEADSFDVRHLLRLTWRRKWLALVCLIALPAAVYALSATAEKTYESSVILRVEATSSPASLVVAEPAQPAAVLGAAARLIQTTGVASEAAEHLEDPPADPRSLLERIAVEPDPNANFITITAQDADPERAAAIGTAFADALVTSRRDEAVARIDQAMTTLREERQSTPRGDDGDQRELAQQIQRLRTLRAAQSNSTEVIEPAAVPSAPVSPRPVRNTVVALILALLLSGALVVLAERLDRRVRESDDIERLVGATLLAMVPDGAFPGQPPTSQAKEAFQTLRASLTYFNVDRPVSSVLVTSAINGEGKTTVATNLAVAVARSGKKVILVDADLRRPQVASRMGVEAKVEHGLSDVLIQEARLEEALVESEAGGSWLRILGAGKPPPNPSELIASARMRRLLSELSELADLVIIDTTPLLSVSDPMPLLEQVSGTVLVARLGYSTRDALTRLHHVVQTAKGTILGAVATGAKGVGLYGYEAYEDLDDQASMLMTAGALNGGKPSSNGGRTPRLLEGVRSRLSRRG